MRAHTKVLSQPGSSQKARSEERAEDIEQYGARSAFPRAALSALLRLHNLLGAEGMEFKREFLDFLLQWIVSRNLFSELRNCRSNHSLAQAWEMNGILRPRACDDYWDSTFLCRKGR